jgi:uncharacterized lipoprotein
MKRLLSALFAIALAGCANTWPETASLNPQINDQPDNVYNGQATISVDSQDSRIGSQIIRVKIKNEPEVLIPNNVSPGTLFADRLMKGFRAQGATISSQGDTHLTVIIEQIQDEITRPGLAYKSRVAMTVKLKAERNGRIITKEYRKSAMKESATQPDIGDIELLMNEHISDLLNQMLGDSQMRTFIKGSAY